MRSSALTRNRNRQQAAAGVSLFPFLAVLICTMGALILLLVVIARRARIQAAQTAAAEQSQQEEQLRLAREDTQWAVEQLSASREQTARQVDEARLELGHIEDHARRLRDRVAQLQAAYLELDTLDDKRVQPGSQLKTQLEQVRAEIAETERRLAELRQAAAQRRRSYAIVPYRGSHETYRRPIYIECREDAVVLQPEGTALTTDDFSGPMGPGNPLAAALRAVREHLLAQGEFDPENSGEPYPLLLIRPDGIGAYYAARTAMDSWGSEFGYELIGEDWRLDFGPPDPELAQVVRQAIDTARVRQRLLAEAAPRHYHRSRQQTRYRVSPTRGGIEVDGGQPANRDIARPSPKAPGTFGRRYDSGASGGDRTSSAGSEDRGPTAGEGAGRASGPETTGFRNAAGEHPTSFGSPREQAELAENRGGAAMRPGEWQPAATPAERRRSGEQADPGGAGEHVESLVKSRGRDWGLPGAADGSVSITRPIRVECHPDRLVVLAERGSARSKTVWLRSRVDQSIDEFVSGVWEHMDSWGIAGRGMYWRPILHVYVAPGGESRYQELQMLLDGSGLAVDKK
ncbi:MAG: hypothetical protein JXB62_17930 [Pirellulales bacterium]|nr:hypothetical protein [Pirellulales bacterium]